MNSRKTSAAALLGRLVIPVGAILVAVPFAATAATYNCESSGQSVAETFIQDLHGEVSGETGNGAAQKSRLNEFIRAKVPVDEVSKFALGVHWRRATERQRTEYRKLFGETVFPTLAEQILRYRKAAYTIVDNRLLKSSDRLVTANVTGTQGGVLKVGWRLKIENCAATATDMIVDGVSLMVMKRQEFASVISTRGIDGLLAALRSKANRIRLGDTGSRQMSQSEMGEIIHDLLRGAAAKVR